MGHTQQKNNIQKSSHFSLYFLCFALVAGSLQKKNTSYLLKYMPFESLGLQRLGPYSAPVTPVVGFCFHRSQPTRCKNCLLLMLYFLIQKYRCRSDGTNNKSGITRMINEELSPGDTASLTNPWETPSYTAMELKTIAPSQIHEIQIQPGRDLLILFTCASPNNWRVLVLCERMQHERSRLA